MDSNQTPPVLAFIPPALLFGFLGWGGVFYLVMNTLPTVGPRWFFFFFWFLGLTGTGLPFVAFFNRRFPGRSPANQYVITRQAIWIGFYGCIMVWLQIGRVATPQLALLLAIGFFIIELMLRLNERSQWRD